MTKRKGIPILGGRATIHPPTPARKSYRITYLHPVSGRRMDTTGGDSVESATAKAREVLGDDVPGKPSRGITPPTFGEALGAYLDANRHRWSSRTVDNYAYLARHITNLFGETPISQISPQMLRAVETPSLSRGQQMKLRTLARGVFSIAKEWVSREPEDYAQAIPVSGTRADDPSSGVSRGDVPTARYVSSIIQLCYSTGAYHPAWEQYQREQGRSFEPTTGGSAPTPRPVLPETVFLTIDPELWDFLDGFPPEFLNGHRRGMPAHYRRRDERATAETSELVSRLRQVGLGVALGAGVGLRIGELLALRVGDFVPASRDVMANAFGRTDHEGTGYAGFVEMLHYRGRLRVAEQASQASQGRIVLSRPKYGKERDAFVPAFLYHFREEPPLLTMNRREQMRHVIGRMPGWDGEALLPRLNDPTFSLWQFSEAETLRLWQLGFVPLGWLLFQRLRELWDELHTGQTYAPKEFRFADFRRLLLFPTRNRSTRRIQVEVPRSWHRDASVVEGFGGYQSQTNYSGRWANPVYDFVSEMLGGYYPEHRTNSAGRRGWTHHGLRHYAASSMLTHGVPLPVVSDQLGHASYDFTLQRYIHTIQGGYDLTGLE